MANIKVKLDEMMARNKMRLNELAKQVDITEANLSILKNGKAKAIRFSTLMALCSVLNCQPADLLEFVDLQSPDESPEPSQSPNMKQFEE